MKLSETIAKIEAEVKPMVIFITTARFAFEKGHLNDRWTMAIAHSSDKPGEGKYQYYGQTFKDVVLQASKEILEAKVVKKPK